MTKNNFSTKEIYELIDKKVGEVNTSIQKLDDRFTRLEEGRLSSIETRIANFEGKIMATTGIIAFAVSVIIAVAQFVIKK